MSPEAQDAVDRLQTLAQSASSLAGQCLRAQAIVRDQDARLDAEKATNEQLRVQLAAAGLGTAWGCTVARGPSAGGG